MSKRQREKRYWITERNSSSEKNSDGQSALVRWHHRVTGRGCVCEGPKTLMVNCMSMNEWWLTIQHPLIARWFIPRTVQWLMGPKQLTFALHNPDNVIGQLSHQVDNHPECREKRLRQVDIETEYCMSRDSQGVYWCCDRAVEMNREW